MHENIVNVVFAVRKEPTDLNSVSASFIFFFLSSYSFYLFIFFETKFSTFLGGVFFILFFYFILLYNTVLVLPYIDMNPPQVYMSSQS